MNDLHLLEQDPLILSWELWEKEGVQMGGISVEPGVRNDERKMCTWSWKMWLPHSTHLEAMMSTCECISSWFNVDIQAWSYVGYQDLECAGAWRQFSVKERKKQSVV